MEKEILLRDYRKGDFEAMFLLDQVCFAEEFRFDRLTMRDLAEARGAIALIAQRREEEIVGFVVVHVEQTGKVMGGYVVTLDVAPGSRKKGLAKKLMQEAEMRVAAKGVRWMQLHVFTGNDGAIRFYERNGYRRVGVERQFYGAGGLDAFVYRKELAS